MAKLSLARANKMIREAFAKAKELEIQPIGVCVYDAGGTLKAYQAPAIVTSFSPYFSRRS